MTRIQLMLMISTSLSAMTVRADATTIEQGPPISPLAWQVLDAKSGNSMEGGLHDSLLGSTRQATSVIRVRFRDERPYGETQEQNVWLARYDSVPVGSPDEVNVAGVTLFLAFQDTGELLCAFTPPAKSWARPPAIKALSIEASTNARWTMSPAHYGSIRSTLTDVMATLWKSFGVDPRKTGQLVLRPRFVAEREAKQDINGNLVPSDGPANAWIVEVLGTAAARRVLLGEERVLTTRVDLFRDGDLKYLGGVIAP